MESRSRKINARRKSVSPRVIRHQGGRALHVSRAVPVRRVHFLYKRRDRKGIAGVVIAFVCLSDSRLISPLGVLLYGNRTPGFLSRMKTHPPKPVICRPHQLATTRSHCAPWRVASRRIASHRIARANGVVCQRVRGSQPDGRRALLLAERGRERQRRAERMPRGRYRRMVVVEEEIERERDRKRGQGRTCARHRVRGREVARYIQGGFDNCASFSRDQHSLW